MADGWKDSLRLVVSRRPDGSPFESVDWRSLPLNGYEFCGIILFEQYRWRSILVGAGVPEDGDKLPLRAHR